MNLEQRLENIEQERLDLIAQGFSFLTNPRIGQLAKEAFHVDRRITIKNASMDELIELISEYEYHSEDEYTNLATEEQERRIKAMTPQELYDAACYGNVKLMPAIMTESARRTS